MHVNFFKSTVALAALVLASGAMAQSTATASGPANAKVIAPITIAATTSLEFGNIVSGVGTVIISPAGSRTDSTTSLTPGTQKGTVNAAVFTIGGEATNTYSITLPSSAIALTNGSSSMNLTNFTVASGGTGSVSGAVGTLASGVGTLNVGATLTSAASQATGTYTGTYAVTVAYN